MNTLILGLLFHVVMLEEDVKIFSILSRGLGNSGTAVVEDGLRALN